MLTAGSLLPPLPPTLPLPCSRRRLAAVAASEDNQERRDHFLALAASLEGASASGEEADDAEYYVSKQWLGWAYAPGMQATCLCVAGCSGGL